MNDNPKQYISNRLLIIILSATLILCIFNAYRNNCIEKEIVQNDRNTMRLISELNSKVDDNDFGLTTCNIYMPKEKYHEGEKITVEYELNTSSPLGRIFLNYQLYLEIRPAGKDICKQKRVSQLKEDITITPSRPYKVTVDITEEVKEGGFSIVGVCMDIDRLTLRDELRKDNTKIAVIALPTITDQKQMDKIRNDPLRNIRSNKLIGEVLK